MYGQGMWFTWHWGVFDYVGIESAARDHSRIPKKNIFQCPSDPLAPNSGEGYGVPRGSYGVNSGHDWNHGISAPAPDGMTGFSRTLDSLRNPSKFMTLGDLWWQYNCVGLGGNGWSNFCSAIYDNWSAGYPGLAHDGVAKINFALADGHVETIKDCGQLSSKFVFDE